MTDLLDALETRANRGAPRGADEVFARAVSVPERVPDRPRRIAAVLAVAVVVALVAAAVLALRHDDPADQGPTDVNPGPEVGTGQRIEGPVFGAETGTTLLVTSYTGSTVALDLDTGTAQRFPQYDVGHAAIARIGDALVFRDPAGDALDRGSLDLSTPPARLPGLVNGRADGSNDEFQFFESGDSGRFWTVTGPIADAPGRSWLAEERDLTAATVTTPAIDLGRDGSVTGATDGLVAVRADGGTQLRDRSTGAVAQTLPGAVVASGGERIVWVDGCEPECALHVLDVDAGSATVPDQEIPASGPATLSPDGRYVAFAGEGGSGSGLLIADLEAGTHQMIPGSEGLTGYAGLPVWSDDSQWVFAGRGDMLRGGIVGYRLGDEGAMSVTVDGLVATTLVAVGSGAGPTFTDPSADCPPGSVEIVPTLPGDDLQYDGEAQANFTTEGSCRAIVTAGSRQEVPVDSDEPSATTVPSDGVVASPLDPTAINVLIANGSGVEGAAHAFSDQLRDIGYQVLEPTDTTGPIEDTPLDTVYFATSPNTRAQAEQVAADLGLSDSAVVPYTDAVTARSDMSLAQVLVVLGSAPGQLATGGELPPRPEVSVSLVCQPGADDDVATAEDLRSLGYQVVSIASDRDAADDGPAVYFHDTAGERNEDAAERLVTDLGLAEAPQPVPDHYLRIDQENGDLFFVTAC